MLSFSVKCVLSHILFPYMQAFISLAKKIKDTKEHNNRVGRTYFPFLNGKA